MPSIADQVATVEHDLAAALASIDTLTAQNAALASANAALQAENAALQSQCSDMKHQVDDVRTMADSLARSALDMLRASRQQIAPALALVPKIDVPQAAADLAADDPRFEIKQGDSGDEQPARIIGKSPLLAAPYGAAGFDADMQKALEADGLKLQQLTGEDHGPVFLDEQPTGPIGFTHCHDCPDPPSCNGSCRLGGPVFVEHDKDDLPIFLKSPQPAAVFG